jgi:hypothetical protein
MSEALHPMIDCIYRLCNTMHEIQRSNWAVELRGGIALHHCTVSQLLTYLSLRIQQTCIESQIRYGDAYNCSSVNMTSLSLDFLGHLRITLSGVCGGRSRSR